MNKHEETIRVLRNEYRFALAQQRESVRGLLNGRLSRSGKTRTRLTNKTKRKEKANEFLD
jgi:hypothetical protein